MPEMIPPKGNPPDPSNRLPRVSLLSIRSLDLLHESEVRDRFGVPLNKNILRRYAVLNRPAEDDGGVLFIEFHGIADAVHLLTRHHRGAGAAEGIEHDRVLLRGVADRIAQQVKGLRCRMILVALGLFEVPYRGLLPVGEPRVLSVLKETVEYGLVLPLII